MKFKCPACHKTFRACTVPFCGRQVARCPCGGMVDSKDAVPARHPVRWIGRQLSGISGWFERRKYPMYVLEKGQTLILPRKPSRIRRFLSWPFRAAWGVVTWPWRRGQPSPRLRLWEPRKPEDYVPIYHDDGPGYITTASGNVSIQDDNGTDWQEVMAQYKRESEIHRAMVDQWMKNVSGEPAPEKKPDPPRSDSGDQLRRDREEYEINREYFRKALGASLGAELESEPRWDWVDPVKEAEKKPEPKPSRPIQIGDRVIRDVLGDGAIGRVVGFSPEECWNEDGEEFFEIRLDDGVMLHKCSRDGWRCLDEVLPELEPETATEKKCREFGAACGKAYTDHVEKRIERILNEQLWTPKVGEWVWVTGLNRPGKITSPPFVFRIGGGESIYKVDGHMTSPLHTLRPLTLAEVQTEEQARQFIGRITRNKLSGTMGKILKFKGGFFLVSQWGGETYNRRPSDLELLPDSPEHDVEGVA